MRNARLIVCERCRDDSRWGRDKLGREGTQCCRAWKLSKRAWEGWLDVATWYATDHGDTVCEDLLYFVVGYTCCSKFVGLSDARQEYDFLEFRRGILLVDGHSVEEAIDGQCGSARGACLCMCAEDKRMGERCGKAVRVDATTKSSYADLT